MKISYNWLRQYLDVTLPPDMVAHLLTNCGLEVESTEKFTSHKGGLEGLVIGEVLTCVRHPNADKLSLTTVNIGSGTPLSIVCGAPNIAAGQKVVVATVGTVLYPTSGESFEIKKSKIRGEASEGMICAEDEIGFGTSHAGVIVLPEDARPGTKAKEYFKVEEDVIFEIGLTPNRVDASSHIGVARDLAAVLNALNLLEKKDPAHSRVSLKLPDVSKFSSSNKSLNIDVTVENREDCPRYTGLSISGVEVKESPAWLQNKLKSIGLNPINNIVDATNYVLHECGQPLHAFDADKITNHKVIVRRAKANEKFKTLDGVERELKADNLLICDSDRPMCIAGVFGGLDSGITSQTKNVFLESAYFRPGSVRKTSRDHGLKTDASFRFERGTDPAITVFAIKRVAMLITEIAGGTISSEISDFYPEEIKPAEVSFDLNYLDRFSGIHADTQVVEQILLDLGFQKNKTDQSGTGWIVPTYKVDVQRPVDVVEEVLRIYGYNRINIPAKLNASMPALPEFSADQWQEKIADYLAANGFSELLNNSLSKSAYLDLPGWEQGTAVKIVNPLSQDLEYLRQTLLGSGMETIEYNRNRKQLDLRLFEFGKVYRTSENGYKEANRLALFMTGKRSEPAWTGNRSEVNFYYLKSFVDAILSLGKIPMREVKKEIISGGEFSESLSYVFRNHEVVRIGLLKKSIAKKWDITDDVYYADIDWDRLLRSINVKPVQVKEISKYPQVRRDLSMLLEQNVSYKQIEEIAYRTERKLLENIFLFDVYEGKNLEPGKKSYALTFILQDEEQTLTDKQIDKTMEKLMAAFEKEAGAVIRRA